MLTYAKVCSALNASQALNFIFLFIYYGYIKIAINFGWWRFFISHLSSLISHLSSLVSRLFHPYKVYAVAEGENHALYPLIVQYMLVEGDNLLRLLILAGNLLYNLAVP